MNVVPCYRNLQPYASLRPPPIFRFPDIKRVTDQYQAVGLPGCCGSIDCTHVGVDKMPLGLKDDRFDDDKYWSH